MGQSPLVSLLVQFLFADFIRQNWAFLPLFQRGKSPLASKHALPKQGVL